MVQQKLISCVTTSRPSASVTVNGGGGSLSILSPDSTTMLSSLRTTADMSGRAALGMSSISLFPDTFSTPNTRLAMAYGENSARANDAYGMLLSVRTGSSPPILHWKSRLPEGQLSAGLVVSPCGYYVVGGGQSGNCYVWASVGGNLLKTFKAHYRSCTCLSWSDCGRYLITGGADGMVHFFSLLDIVRKTVNNAKRSISPIHSWSCHTMKVNQIIPLQNGRILTASDDGQMLILELFSHSIVASLQLPHSIQCVVEHQNRIFAGSSKGTIYIIDLDSYAVHKTAQMGVASATKRRRRGEVDAQPVTSSRDVFQQGDVAGIRSDGAGSSSNINPQYQTELTGHERPVSAIAVASIDQQDILISGDEFGTIRTWDIDSRGSLAILRPWSNETSTSATTQANTKKKTVSHPITSILVLPEPDTAETSTFGSGGHRSSNSNTIVRLISPLKRYEQDVSGNEDDKSLTVVPFLACKRDAQTLRYWDVNYEQDCGDDDDDANMYKYDQKVVFGEDATVTDTLEGTAQDDAAIYEEADDGEETMQLREQVGAQKKEMERLQKELEAQRSQVERWETVNNKLLARLKRAEGKGK